MPSGTSPLGECEFRMLVYADIEKLKQEYTDKWVAVDATQPALARYKDRFGQIKTVNMNGRALVEFHGGVDIGWIDIDLDCLNVVPKPDFEALEAKQKAAEKAAPKKEAAKPAAKAAPAAGDKKLSPLEMARMGGAAKKDGGGKSSTADILAAARAKGGTAQPSGEVKPSAPKAAGGKPSTADILAAARAKKGDAPAPEAKAAPAKPAAAKEAPAAKSSGPVDKAKMSVADMLAAARGQGGAAPAKEAPAKETPAKEAPAKAEPVAEAKPASAPAAEKPAKPAGGALPKDVPGILDYCRQADTK